MPTPQAALALHPVAHRHAPALQLLASAREVAATTRIPHPYPPGGAQRFIAAMVAARQNGTAHAFAIERDGEFVGMCGLHGVGERIAEDLGYWVGVPFQGQGIATFAVARVLRFGFDELQLECIRATVLESNAPSHRVLLRRGFRCTGVGPHRDPLLKSPDEPVAAYELTAAEWRQRG